MAPREAGIGAEVPLCPESIGMDDEERIVRPRHRELLRLAHLLPDRSVVRNEVATISLAEDHGSDVADAGVPDLAAPAVDLRDEHRRAARRAHRGVRRYQHLRRRRAGLGMKHCDRWLRRGRGVWTVPEPVGHDQPAAVLDVHDVPRVAAERLAGMRLADDADRNDARLARGGRGVEASHQYRALIDPRTGAVLVEI